jgi:hypothetical protein
VKVFCSLFIGIGALLFCFGVNLAFQSIRCGSWPTADGTIRTSTMGRHRGNKGGTTYSADVSYDYSAGGARYTGTKVAFGMMSASSDYAQSFLNRYPVGAKVPVYYSPSDPATAVLETGIHGGTWMFFGASAIVALFGIMFLQVSRRQADANQTGSTAGRGGTRISAPPILMGVIFVLFGIFPIVMARTSGNKSIVMYMAGGLFCLVGLYIMTYRPENIRLARFFSGAISLLLLAIFHWLAFVGLGGVDTFIAVILAVIDLIFLAVVVRWLFKRMKVKARGLQ